MLNFNRGTYVLGGHEIGIYSVTNVLVYSVSFIVIFFALVELKEKVVT